MKRTYLAAFVFVSGSAMLITRWTGPTSNVYTPTGFVEQANRLIAGGKLTLACDAPGRRAGDPPRDSIVTQFQAGTDDDHRRWYLRSYLVGDVRRFNANPEMSPGPFLVDVDACRLLGVDPYFHRVSLPYNPILHWRGDVRLSGGGVTASLENSARQQVVRVRQPADTMDHSLVTVRAGTPGTVAASFVNVTAAPADYVATAHFVGEFLVLADARRVGSQTSLRLNGFLGDASKGRPAVWLETGDWIRIEPRRRVASATRAPADEPSTFVATTGNDSRVVSFVRSLNRRVDRVFTHEALRPMLSGLARAIEAVMQDSAGKRGRGADSMNVQLTLDRPLDDALRARLLQFCQRGGLPRTAERPRAISMLAMDAFTGAVVAMPSCPSDEEISSLGISLTQRERERWLRNQNLLRHPIGSAGKPFWAAAVASSFPNLVDAEIPAHPSGLITNLGGCEVEGYADHAHGATWVGLEEFIARSCNRYVIEAVTASLVYARTADCRRAGTASQAATCFPAVDPAAPTGRLRICDQLVQFVVAPQTYYTGTRCGELNSRRLPNAGVVERFEELTNVSTVLGGRPQESSSGPRVPTLEPQFRSQQFRLDAWAPVLESLTVGMSKEARLRSQLRFTGVAPERANLALNTAHDLRQDWVNMLLGGGQARWTNFELAEALSRLMVGRQVFGTLVANAGRSRLFVSDEVSLREAPLFDSTALRSGVRRRVLYGMSRVIDDPQGTATALQGGIAKLERDVRSMGYELQAFAKTGTPTVEVAFSKRSEELVERVFRRGVVFRPGDSTFTWSSLGETSRDSAWFETTILAPMRGDPGGYRAIEGVGPEGHPLYLDGPVVRYQGVPSGRLRRQGGVLILGLLAVPVNNGRGSARNDGDWISACPSGELTAGVLGVPRASALHGTEAVGLSVAAYIDDLPSGQGSPRAVALVNSVLDDLGTHLKRQVALKRAEKALRDRARASGF